MCIHFLGEKIYFEVVLLFEFNVSFLEAYYYRGLVTNCAPQLEFTIEGRC